MFLRPPLDRESRKVVGARFYTKTERGTLRDGCASVDSVWGNNWGSVIKYLRTLNGIKILIENSKPVYALVSTTGRGKWGQTLDHYCVDVSYQAPFDSGGKKRVRVQGESRLHRLCHKGGAVMHGKKGR